MPSYLSGQDLAIRLMRGIPPRQHDEGITQLKETEMAASAIAKYSDELAVAAAQAELAVVTVYARRRIPSSGIYWRDGVVVTAEHAIRREDEIKVALPDGKRVAGQLAGRDPGTDLAVLRLESGKTQVPQFGDPAHLKLANFVLALGRTRSGNLVASAGIIGGIGGEWRTWRGGRIDQSIRLDLELYPGFSGGPLVSVEGKVLGVNTNGLGRGRAVTIPVATVNRTVDELLAKGYIARPYLGVAMQPVAVPENLRAKLESAPSGGLMVLHVEAGSPAEKAGIVLGDTIVELAGKLALDTESVRELLGSAKVGDSITATVLRAGEPVELSIKLSERPAR
jgi:S1-C subfamily serine protease